MGMPAASRSVRGWSFTGGGVVHVDRVDAHQHGVALDQRLGAGFGKVRVFWIGVSLGTPRAIPSGSQQHRGPGDEHVRERADPDGPHPVDEDCWHVGAVLQGQLGQVLSVLEPVRRRIEVGAGVGDHDDAPDGELGARGVVLVGGVKAEVLTDLRAWKSGRGDHPVVDDVTEIDEAHAWMMADAARRRPPWSPGSRPVDGAA